MQNDNLINKNLNEAEEYTNFWLWTQYIKLANDIQLFALATGLQLLNI